MKKKELDINEDMPHENLKWKIERIGWIILLLIIVAAIFGFLGSGPFSSRSVKNKVFTLKYRLIERYESPAELEYITQFIPKNDFSIWINTAFLKELGDLKIHPEPINTYIADNNSVFVFDERESNHENISITFQFRHNKAGIRKLRTGVENDFVELTQYILP